MSTPKRKADDELVEDEEGGVEDTKRLRATDEPNEAETEEAHSNNDMELAAAAQAAVDGLNQQQEQQSMTTKKDLPLFLIPDHLSPTSLHDFDHFLFYAILYRSHNKNFSVKKELYPKLYEWLQFLKKEYKAHTCASQTSSLTLEQIQTLEYLHIPLSSRGETHWSRFYQQLCRYKERHGHVLVPRLCEVPGLGDWVTEQRRQYKAMRCGQSSVLNPERLAQLERLGFVWQVRHRPEWDARYRELLEYKAKFGDCRVPQHYKANRALGKWVAKQREQHKLLTQGRHSFLTPYRLEKLNEAGFAWQVRASLEGDVHAAVMAEAAVAAPPEELKAEIV